MQEGGCHQGQAKLLLEAETFPEIQSRCLPTSSWPMLPCSYATSLCGSTEWVRFASSTYKLCCITLGRREGARKEAGTWALSVGISNWSSSTASKTRGKKASGIFWGEFTPHLSDEQTGMISKVPSASEAHGSVFLKQPDSESGTPVMKIPGFGVDLVS